MDEKQRCLWLDYIRSIATILVVLLHTAASYLYQMNQINISSWLAGNYVDSFTRISVPLFFMISGFLFFRDKTPKLKNFIRIIAALFFYSFISLLYIKLYQDVPVAKLIKGILFKPVYYHLWFFYSIIIIYMLSMFITIRNVNSRHVFILFIICFIAINPRLTNLTSLLGYTYSSRMQLDGTIIYFLIYGVFGAILGSVRSTSFTFKASKIGLVLYVLTSILVGYETYIVSVYAGKFRGIFYDYSGPLVAIGAISVFFYIKEHHEKLRFLRKPVNVISQNSLAIFGVHAPILDYIYSSGYRNYNNPLVDIPLTFAIVFLVSLIIGMFIKHFDKTNMVT